jgi:hypothetical protein
LILNILQLERQGIVLAECPLFSIMDRNLLKLTTQQLRSLFLIESKKFLKTLDYHSPVIEQELKDQMLNEIRENMKQIMHLIELKERQELQKN